VPQFLSVLPAVVERARASLGDLICFAPIGRRCAQRCWRIAAEDGQRHAAQAQQRFCVAGVVNFPLFEYDEDEKRS